ncbi:MAG: methyltransferase [Clostridia bacterium]|nr:methyltransferase [Clostridia bacterium]
MQMCDNVSKTVDTDFLDNTVTDRVNDGIILTQRNTGLKFGTDALFLSAFVPERTKPTVAAELGSGTGIISLLVLQRKKADKAFAFEVQECYARLTEHNARQNGFSESLTAICKNVCDVRADDCGGEVDIVVSNPPYMLANGGLHPQNEEKDIAKREVLGSIEDFAQCASRLLKWGGSFYCVYRPDRLPSLITALKDANLEPKKLTLVYDNPTSKPCLVLISARKGSGEELNITRPLYLKSSADSKEYSKEVQAVFDGKPLEL